MTATYATPEQLARYLNIENSIPDLDSVGTARTREVVGTGDSTNTLFYLDHAYVIDNTLNLIAGKTESAATALTLGTDYSIVLDKGNITLTGTGVTNVGTATLYGDYSYNRIKITNTQLQEALNRAQSEIDGKTMTHFATGTEDTPDWEIKTRENQKGKGTYLKDYYADHFPIPDINTTVTGTAVTAADTSIWVDNTQGFPSTGVLSIESDKIEYTGKTGSAFTGCTSVSAHGTATTVYPWCIEISMTDSGSTPSWQPMQSDTDYDLDLDTGKVHLYNDDYGSLSILDTSIPPISIPNRFRISYPYGYSTIPADITRLAMMIASKDLMRMAVRKAISDGNNDFNPDIINVDEEWITQTLDRYSSHNCSNI